MDNEEALLEDALAPQEVTTADLGVLSGLLDQLVDAYKTRERLEQELERVKSRIQVLENTTIPETMTAIKIDNFTTTDGVKVEVVNIINASIPSDQREAAIKWLEDNGHGGLVKTEVVAAYPKGQQHLAAEEAKQLHAASVKINTGVHYQTLNAWVREMFQKGSSIPLELFGVYTGRVAKVRIADKAPQKSR